MKIKPRPTVMTLATLLCLLLAYMLCHAVSAVPDDVDPRIRVVLSQQHSYFQHISSLQFDAELVVKYGEPCTEAGVPVGRAESRLRFVSSGPKYRAETTCVDVTGGKEDMLTVAFDGEKYQVLVGPAEKPFLSVGRTKTTQNVYGSMHPVLAPFAWAFLPDDEESLTELQDADKWLDLATMVLACRDAAWTDPHGTEHSGVELEFKRPGSTCVPGDVTYTVFFASTLDYLPVHTTLVAPGVATCDASITGVQLCDTSAGPLALPTRFEWQGYDESGTFSDGGWLEIDPHTLKVNQPVDEAVFTIPTDGVYRYTDRDTGVTIEP